MKRATTTDAAGLPSLRRIGCQGTTRNSVRLLENSAPAETRQTRHNWFLFASAALDLRVPRGHGDLGLHSSNLRENAGVAHRESTPI